MNRVVKFRGKRVDNGEWIYGCAGYGFSGNMEYIMPKMYFATRDFGEEDKDGNPVIDDEIAIGGFIPVVPESVGQFTGLLDKNGKEIYEGDIVNIGFGGDRSVSYSEHKSIIVYWDSDRLQFCVKYRNEIVSLVGYHLPKYEIIGNVYEAELTNK